MDDNTRDNEQAAEEHGETMPAAEAETLPAVEEGEDGVKTVMSDRMRQFNERIDQAVDQ